MKYAKAEDAVMAEINITPFTDVLLVLLIIFMILAALITPPGFEKSLQNSCGLCSAPSHRSQKIEITITKNGRIFVGAQVADVRTVYGALAAAVRGEKKPSASIIADMKAPYGLIIRTLDAAKEANISDVSFVSQ